METREEDSASKEANALARSQQPGPSALFSAAFYPSFARYKYDLIHILREILSAEDSKLMMMRHMFQG